MTLSYKYNLEIIYGQVKKEKALGKHYHCWPKYGSSLFLDTEKDFNSLSPWITEWLHDLFCPTQCEKKWGILLLLEVSDHFSWLTPCYSEYESICWSEDDIYSRMVWNAEYQQGGQMVLGLSCAHSDVYTKANIGLSQRKLRIFATRAWLRTSWMN